MFRSNVCTAKQVLVLVHKLQHNVFIFRNNKLCTLYRTNVHIQCMSTPKSPIHTYIPYQQSFVQNQYARAASGNATYFITWTHTLYCENTEIQAKIHILRIDYGQPHGMRCNYETLGLWCQKVLHISTIHGSINVTRTLMGGSHKLFTPNRHNYRALLLHTQQLKK
jgi:hypothetical protein